MQLANNNYENTTSNDMFVHTDNNCMKHMFVHNNSSYYMSRYNNIQGKWEIIPHKFMLNISDNNQLIGEFTSTLWFKNIIDTNISTTFLILKDDDFFSREGFMAAFCRSTRIIELENMLNSIQQSSNQNNDYIIDRFVLTYDEIFNFYKYAKSGEQHTVENISGETNYMNRFNITLCKDLNYTLNSNIYGLYAYCPRFVINL